MFRITSHIDDGEIVLKLEGCLAGVCVQELDACWREATKAHGPRPVRLDLREVCHVDDAGRELMMSMHRARVRFMTRGCVMPELVREIAQSAGGNGRN
jgi:anti-anti-sigma regulatory factor